MHNLKVVREMMMRAFLTLVVLVPFFAEAGRVGVSEQVERYLCEHGIKKGMDNRPDGSVAIVQTGQSSFKYGRGMANDEYFSRREKAVHMAYADAMSKIAFDINSEVKSVSAGLCDTNALRMSTCCGAEKGAYAFLKEGFEHESIDVVLGKLVFSRFFAVDEETSGETAANEPVEIIEQTSRILVNGVSRTKLFSDIDGEMVNVELIVMCDVQFGQDACKSVATGTRLDGHAKEIDLEEFVKHLADDLQSAPCTLVDRHGMLWGLGVAVGSRGQRPFGWRFDEMARASASLALGCEVSAEKVHRTKGNLMMIEQNVQLDSSSFPYATNYPENLALYFHKDTVDGLTGRKCTVSICALPTGASAAARANAERERENRRQNTLNSGRIAGIRALFSK